MLIIMNSELQQPTEERRFDSLTNLPDRLSLNAGIAEAIETIPGQFGLLELDVDDLKMLNDTMGHLEGDEYLKFIGGVLKDLLRDDDRFVAGHKSGDEFTIILNGVTSNEQVDDVRQRIIKELDSLGVIVSIGGRVHIPGETAEQLMIDADRLMVLNKHINALEALTPEQIAGHVEIGRIAARETLNIRKTPVVLAALKRKPAQSL